MSWNKNLPWSSSFYLESIKFRMKSYFKQKDLEIYLEAWERFKDLFSKYPNLDIIKEAHVYIFYYGLRLEYHNISNTFTGGLVMKI